jgi:hypothetical protein
VAQVVEHLPVPPKNNNNKNTPNIDEISNLCTTKHK